MQNRRLFRPLPPLASAIAVIATAIALFLATFTQISPQWIAFLTGVLVGTTLVAVTRASRAEWVVMRRMAQLEIIKDKFERETQLRKISDIAITEGKMRLYLIDEMLPTMLVLVDQEGICRYHNRAFQTWLELKPEQINGRHMRDVLGDKVYQETATATRQSLEGRTVHYERTHTMADGRVYRLSVDHRPQLGDDGKVSGFYMVTQDVTSANDVRTPVQVGSVSRAVAVPIIAKDGAADQAMYVDSFSEQITGQKDAGKQIMEAIENNEFCLFSQRITPLGGAQGEVEHYEILVRLLNEEESMMPPGAFFPLAEKLGLMTHLDRWVVQQVAQWIATKNLAGKPQGNSMYFINVAESTICNPGFPEFLQLTISEHGVSSSALCFEISNAELRSINTDVAEFARRVRQCGCRVALGGFGRDRILFDLIRGFQVEFLKIDGSIIFDVLRDPVAHAKVAAISRVAKKIGVKTVAECVESDEIIGSLKEIGIDFAQGFGISRPQPLAD